MKSAIQEWILSAARKAHAAGVLPSDLFPVVEVDEPKSDAHGDFATNFAMLSAKSQKLAPRKIAQALVDHLATIGYDSRYGARPLQRAIEQHVTGPLAHWLLTHSHVRNGRVFLDVDADRNLSIQV